MRWPSGLQPAPAPHPAVRDVCLAMCPQCGGSERVYVETDNGITSHCYQCGDQSALDHRPFFCPRHRHDN